MAPRAWIFLATSVTDVRRTPSISDRNSCVSASVSLPAPIATLQQPAAKPRLHEMAARCRAAVTRA